MRNEKDRLKKFIKVMIFIFLLPFRLFKIFLSLISKLRKKISVGLKFSITFKITSIYTLIFTFIYLIISIIILGGFSLYIGTNVENNMQKNFQLIAYNLKQNSELPKENILEISQVENISIDLFDMNNKLIYSTEGNNKNIIFYNKSISSRLEKLNENYKLLTSNGSAPWLILNNTSKWYGEDVQIQIRYNLYRELLKIIVLFFALIITNIIFVIITIRIGSKASKKMLKPVETMTFTVKNITVNALNTRLDISGAQDELKELAITFNNMLNRIQRSYEEQKQFVSDASHELRTPISVIQGYANLLSRWGKDDRAVLEESIDAIKTESENMKLLIENLLFLARGDNDREKIEMTNFQLNELIDEVIKETILIDKGHEIINDRNDNVIINADRKLLKQALRVFIDNSIKYTPVKGKIIIDSLSQNTSEIMISIQDTGIGIPKEDLPNIFNRFYRADKSRTKETGGTGLGLAIAKWIILKHRGTINVKSKVNEGTTVCVFLPSKS
jgi:signal transduction histidine kinase